MAYTNLQYLKTMTGGNKEILCDIIKLFIFQVPDFISNMNKYYESQQYLALGREAHKAKSSLQIMGMNELEIEMKNFQLKTIESADIESYQAHIHHFETQCLAAIKELQAAMVSL
jgi:HPt (histidine-containing phosphotransfer) domain-containing protein